MGIIRLLDDRTINKIAAGEVIEKPASIVKELVENSIDAGANEIIVETRGGGISLIRVTDNGKGIDKEDLENAFLRHATSKIMDDRDLDSIATLGFRGEALASIASVSKVEMISRTKDNELGNRIQLEGGKALEKEQCGAPEGTVITVRELFFNTPARLKFLKTESREGMYITDVMQNMAMSHANISFKYKANDKMIFATKGDGDLKSVILSVYGKEIANNLIEVNCSREFITVKGYVGNSNISKNNRNYQSIFINGRYIKNKTITAAVEAAYKSMLTINKFPAYILHLYINPEFVDVNVHPAKAEVKFQDDQIIFKAVYHCTKDSLLSISPILGIQGSTQIESEPNQFELISKNNLINEAPKTSYTQQEFKIENPGRKSLDRDEIYDNGYSFKTPIQSGMEEKPGSNKEYRDFTISGYIHNSVHENNSSDEEKTFNTVPKFEPLAVVGQIHFTYIAAEGQDEMYLIDQHAAHERIYYENYMSEYRKSSIQSQSLLVPIVINLALSEKQQVFDNMELFKKFGYEIEDFGGNSIALRCVPTIYGNPDNEELFHEILDTFDIKDKDIYHVIDKVVYTMACKSAIKAGDKLNYREMNELIERLRYCDNPYNCPHGRPTIIKTSYTELEKKFKRIQ